MARDGLKKHEDTQYRVLELERLFAELESTSVHSERFRELVKIAALAGLRAEIARLSEKLGA